MHEVRVGVRRLEGMGIGICNMREVTGVVIMRGFRIGDLILGRA